MKLTNQLNITRRHVVRANPIRSEVIVFLDRMGNVTKVTAMDAMPLKFKVIDELEEEISHAPQVPQDEEATESKDRY